MKNKQYSSSILMIEPTAFYYNPETAVNNFFQNKTEDSKESIQDTALKEFNQMVFDLRSKGINVITIKDTENPHTPDSIFPNNWISFHEDGTVVLYPMFAKNRRHERREDDVINLLEKQGFSINNTIDFSSAEKEDIFLEGTGSIILDRENELAYACISERTNEKLFIEFCKELEYTPIIFHAYQTVNGQRKPIYHTNVMMCIADKYAIICLDSIDNKKERERVCKYIFDSGKEIITISEDQMHQFAGNMLQVGQTDQPYLVMSRTAYNSLTSQQKNNIEKYNSIIPVKIDLIEKLGGGSARCMIAEIFLPK